MIAEKSKSFGLGVLWYKLYHAPRGYLKKLKRDGLFSRMQIKQGMKEMEEAAWNLPRLSIFDEIEEREMPEIYFLSGKRFWYQMAYCAASMIIQSKKQIRVVVVDDGSLEEKQSQKLENIFPFIKIISRAEIENKLDEKLPRSKYPTLRARRLEYPHLRKLTDVHVLSGGWKLVSDSDMIFFREPTEVISWLDNPKTPLYMMDVIESYGYSRNLLEGLAGEKLPEKVNVGLCGLNSDEIRWNNLEEWCRVTIEREGTHYVQEQALTAMMLAGIDCEILSATDYRVMPDANECKTPTAKLHHYVANSKVGYFVHGWKIADKEIRSVCR